MEMGGADIVGGGKRELQPLMDSPLHRGDKGKGSKQKKKKKRAFSKGASQLERTWRDVNRL